MYVPFSTYHVFGSGAASAYLIIDGVRINRAYVQAQGWEVRCEDNGFVGEVLADIPIETILGAKKVDYECGAIPGGTTEIRAGGRHFVKKFLGCRNWRKDPLIENKRLRLSKAEQKRHERKRERMYEWAKARGKVRLDQFGCKEWRVTFRLPDGSRGGRWDRFASPMEIGYDWA
jgi:hypothetical protein